MFVVTIAFVVLFCWAVGDIFLAISARKVGHPKTLLANAVATTAVLMLILPATLNNLHLLNGRGWTAMFISTLLFGAVFLAYLKALELGPVTVVGAISGSFPVLVVVLSVVFLGESLTGIESAFIALSVIGIALCLLDVGELHQLHVNSPGVLFAFITFLCWGVAFTLQKVVADQAGWQVSGFLPLFINLPIAVWRMHAAGVPFRFPWAEWKWGLLAAIASVGFLLANLALEKGNASIVIPIAGAYPVLFAYLSHRVFHDRMTARQYAGVCVALAAVVGLSIASV